jgi:mannose/fructose/N-acetylgalactosamine-specific phosphotransferase system component IID
MAELSNREAHQLARRLFLIQVLLNYRTMQGGGYLFALWPWVRKQKRRAEIAHDAAGYLNSHPVFAAFAVGAMRRELETHPLVPPLKQGGEFAAWRESLAGPLGMTGDALIWDRWKPLVLAAGACVLLIAPSMAVWAIAATVCLIAYNTPLYMLRVWGVRQGYALGAQVLTVLRDKRFALWQRRLTVAGAILAGALFGTATVGASQGDVSRGVQFLVALGVMLLGLRFRLSAATAAVLAIVAALVFPMFP